MSQSQGQDEPSFGRRISDAYSKWFYETPAITRCIVLVSIAGTVLGLMGIDDYFGKNTPHNTLIRLQVWRIFTTGFIGQGILMDVFAVFSIYQVCAMLEPKKGSMFLLVSSIASTVLIQFLSVMLMMLLASLFTPLLLVVGGGGYWPLAFVFIALESTISTSQSRQFMCFPFEVPTKVYPIILALFFYLLSGLLSVDILLGLLLGYASGRHLRLQPSVALCRKLELWPFLRSVVQLTGFVTIDGLGYLMSTGDPIQDSQLATQRPSSPFSAFSGVGYKLGTTSDLDSEEVFRPVAIIDRYTIPSSAIEVPSDAKRREEEEDEQDIAESYLV